MKVAIIGAGIAGLAAARELAKAGHGVTVYEAGPNAGGLASGFRDPRWDWPLERFYHHLFTSDTAIRQLVAEIGYGHKLSFLRQVTAQWWRGRPRALQGGLDVVKVGPAKLPVPDLAATALSVAAFPALPPLQRVRLGLVSAYLKYAVRDWRPLEKVTAAEWTRRWMGESAYRAFVFPLLEGKFGEFAGEVNMAWLWARLKSRSFRLGYFEGGFQGFVDALLEHVRAQGVQVTLNAPVSRLEQEDGGWRLQVAGGSPFAPSDAVIATVAPRLLSTLAPGLPEDYLRQILGLRSMGAVVMTIALRHRLTEGFYWINVPKDEFPFLALVEHTNFIGAEHYGGDHLIYCGDYLNPTHEHFRLTPEALLDRFLPALKAVNPRFSPDWVRAYWLHREVYAQPIVPVNQSRNIPPLATPIAGLYWASMSHVYPWDRGTNYAVELGQRAAKEVVEYFSRLDAKPAG